ncbi:hypothetical protein EZV62_006163 [Acer yangbiense]|uniref:NB-ARC domain-containing protein n=1 Tax=Acer yangbiense TaxID=1000413 RepID=A0A5C7IQ61_9ROSI|nr:hypothetical protein EZV62_006163 [Acer yangbiense]
MRSCMFYKGNLYNINICKTIEDLKNKLNDIYVRCQHYGLQEHSNEGRSNAFGRLRVIRRSVSLRVEENVVGFENDAKEMLTKLLDNEAQCFTISIYGMGGLVKTTLVGKIVKSFEFKTIKMEDPGKMNGEDLGRYLFQSLQGRSYLLVIDDVWNNEAWMSLKAALPDNKTESRVIIITRSKKVTESSNKRTHAHNLCYLKPFNISMQMKN